MMKEWIENDHEFRFLTYCLVQEICGNPLSQKDVTEKFETDEFLERLSTKKWIRKKYKYICPNCKEMIYLMKASDFQICNKCGETIEIENINFDELEIRYEVNILERLNNFIESVFKFDYELRKDDFEEIPFDVLEKKEKNEDISFYFSPFYNFKDSIIRSERYPNQFFVNWKDLPDILFEYEIEEIKRKLKIYNKAKSKTIKHFNLSRKDIPTDDYKLLGILKEKRNQAECTKIINEKGYKRIKYNIFFEKMSISVLFDLFKFAEGFHLGGKNKPDGILFFPRSKDKSDTCFIESKCYSRDFFLNSEKGKAGEYIRKFRKYIHTEGQFGDILHYILISTDFSDSELIHRISDYEKDYGISNFIILSEVQLISLRELYDESKLKNPSFPRRLFCESDSYIEFLQHLHNFSKEFIDNISGFSNMNKKFFNLVNKKLEKENTINHIFADKKNNAEVLKKQFSEEVGQVSS